MKKASRIRLINNQMNYLNGLMVAALSGKNVQFVNKKSRVHKSADNIGVSPQIRVIRKINLGEEVTRQSVESAIAKMSIGINSNDYADNCQSGGTKAGKLQYPFKIR